MSWVPRDLASLCTVQTTVTNCQPPTFLFLQLIAGLFGRSPDGDGGQAAKLGLNNPADFGNFLNQNAYGAKGFPGNEQFTEYDFIVVGAGSAGCVLANRLTEIKQWNVLLLEAGGEEPEVADVPGFAPALMSSSIDWGYSTQPQPNSCRARPENRCSWARGRAVGGTSVINYMIYMRGAPQDYDQWASVGNEGWSYRDVLPYFIKSERNHNLDKVQAEYHGDSGPLDVQFFPYQDENVFVFIDGLRELGLPLRDQTAERTIGTQLSQHTNRDGMRLSVNVAYLRPIRYKRKNLTVQPNAEVIRVLIDPNTKRAYGVEYVRNGKLQRALARKEVIVSGGTINSPKILMLSGVGPAEQLQQLNIQVIKDLRVGFNLQDHTTIDGVLFRLNKTSTAADDATIRDEVYRYKQTRRGPLSCTGPLQINAMVQTQYAPDPYRPDIQYSFDAANVQNYLTDPILTSRTIVTPLAYYDGIMVRPILLHPRSRGVIMLNFTDPIFGDPMIFANTFTEKVDLLSIVDGVKQSLNLINTETFRKAGITLDTTPWPACRSYKFGTDEYWACVAVAYTSTLYHPVGTCKMGPKKDPTAVVDHKLRVHGIENLRVIDASIMPTVPGGNTNAPTIMVAEMGSDFIKERWLKNHHSDLPQGSDYFTSQEYYSDI